MDPNLWARLNLILCDKVHQDVHMKGVNGVGFAHQVILSECSTFLHKIFSKHSLTNDNEPVCIILPDFSAECLISFLALLYQGETCGTHEVMVQVQQLITTLGISMKKLTLDEMQNECEASILATVKANESSDDEAAEPLESVQCVWKEDNIGIASVSLNSVQAFQCPICGKALSARGGLRRHLKTHSGEKPNQCTLCNKAFLRRSGLNRHVRTVHQEAIPEEDKKNSTSSSRSTAKGPPVKCTFCEKTFLNKSGLDRHVSCIHATNPKEKQRKSSEPFLCPVCGHVSSSRHNIAQHMRIHSGERPFQCHLCTKAFTFKSSLNDHIRVHTGEKPFQCSECGNTFKCRRHLNEHMRIHTGERPFKCSVCGKAFSHGNHMRLHMRIHSGEKPYQCPICRKHFSRRYNCTAHMKLHFKNS